MATSDLSLSYDQYVDFVQQNAATAHAALQQADSEAAVPDCGEWKAADLRDHISGVFAFWSHQLKRQDMTGEDFPDDVRKLYARPIADAAQEITALLRETGPGIDCWNWSGRNMTTDWAARRMAQEIAVHRTDAERTVGLDKLTPIDEGLAADGIDELLEVFLRPAADFGFTPSNDSPAHVIRIEAPERTWNLAVGDGVATSTASPELTIRGPVDQLLLTLWGRTMPIELDGDRQVLTRLLAQPAFGY